MIIGLGEWAEGNVTVRDMTTGEQRVVAAAAATEAVAGVAKHQTTRERTP